MLAEPILSLNSPQVRNKHLKGNVSDYPNWIAAYSRCSSSIDWDIHQYSETGRLNGIPGKVDLNYSSESKFGL